MLLTHRENGSDGGVDRLRVRPAAGPDVLYRRDVIEDVSPGNAGERFDARRRERQNRPDSARAGQTLRKQVEGHGLSGRSARAVLRGLKTRRLLTEGKTQRFAGVDDKRSGLRAGDEPTNMFLCPPRG